jgi:hypothetical protein
LKSTVSISDLKVGDIWMGSFGTRLQIIGLPKDREYFYVRVAGKECTFAWFLDELAYRIS